MNDDWAPEAQNTGSSASIGHVLRVAWPAAAAFLLNNAYRINDQYWIQGLGEPAQSAVGTSMFVFIMSFALAFIAAGGALSLVARAKGSADRERFIQVTRNALGLAFFLGLCAAVFVTPALPLVVKMLGLSGITADHAVDYMSVLFMSCGIMYLVPTLDNTFIACGRTLIPMALNVLAISINFLLNPLLIYGSTAAEVMPDAPFVQLVANVGSQFGIDGLGMAGAGWATVASRAVSASVGLLVLRYGFGIPLLPTWRPNFKLLRELVRISIPASLSIALYAGVYWTLFALVVAELPDPVKAGLGIGFQVFEGVAFPCYLGVGMAAASLVGQALGAGDRARALAVADSSRKLGRIVGVITAALFFILARPVAELFTRDPAVLEQAVLYVLVLACSQYWVGVEVVNERILLGAGETRSIPWISGCCNAIRVPLGWVLALSLGYGAVGLWWAINATTLLKAFLFWREVQKRDWLERLGS